MHWPSVLSSANPLRKGQCFVRPSRKDAGRDLCGRRDGVFQVSRTKPCAQFEPFIAETEHGHRLSTELDGCEFKGRFVGHDPFPLVRGPTVCLIGRGGSAAPSFCCLYWSPTLRRYRQRNAMPDFCQRYLLLLFGEVYTVCANQHSCADRSNDLD